MPYIGAIFFFILLWKLLIAGLFYGAIINWYYWLPPIIAGMFVGSILSKKANGSVSEEWYEFFGWIIGGGSILSVIVYYNWDEIKPWWDAIFSK